MALSDILRRIKDMKDNLLQTRADLAHQTRLERLRAALKTDITDTATILKADFGTGQPNGLDIRAYPATPLHLAVMENDQAVMEMTPRARKKYIRITGGFARRDGTLVLREVYLRQLRADAAPPRRDLPKYLGASTVLSHESLHHLQFLREKKGWCGIGDNHVQAAPWLAQIGGRIWGYGTGEAVAKLYRGALDFIQERKTGRTIGGYYNQAIEVHARLHEIMVAGYPQWERLPTNRTELFAVLYNAGIRLPLRTTWMLLADPAGRQAVRDFRADPLMKAAIREVVTDLNVVGSYALGRDDFRKLWDRTIPLFYGDMLELYGDTRGRERLGFGPAPYGAQAVMAAMITAREEQRDIPAATAQSLAAAVEPVHINELLCRLIILDDADAGPMRTLVTALLREPRLRVAVCADKPQFNPENPMDEHPLLRAVLNGRKALVGLLLEAGVSPAAEFKNDFGLGPLGFKRDLARIAAELNDIRAAVTAHDAQPESLRKKFNADSMIDGMRLARALYDQGMSGMLAFYDNDPPATLPQDLRTELAAVKERVNQMDPLLRRLMGPEAPASATT